MNVTHEEYYLVQDAVDGELNFLSSLDEVRNLLLNGWQQEPRIWRLDVPVDESVSLNTHPIPIPDEWGFEPKSL